MTANRLVKASSSTHFTNAEKVAVKQGEAGLDNSQKAQKLFDPEDLEGGNTHSGKDVQHNGPKKVPTVASYGRRAVRASGPGAQSGITDLEAPTGGKIAEIENGTDPSKGYLDQAAGMPVIQNAAFEDEEGEDEFSAEEDEPIGASSEFDDLPSVNEEGEEGEEGDLLEGAEEGEFDEDLDGMEPLGVEPEEVEGEFETEEGEGEDPALEMADFEGEETGTDDVPLVDTDEVSDADEKELHFASIGASLHVIRSNRIIASMGPKAARMADVLDVYQLPQFQDVTAHAIATKGLRKGLVQSGFKLACVKLSASKAADKVVKAKVLAGVKQQMDLIARKDEALEQSLAIAAVGINRHFFKDVTNELKAGLESELETAGVRGGQRMVRAMFAQHGVSYAKAILSLAKKISAMPIQVRNQYSAALDMTDDTDFGPETAEVEETEEEDEIDNPTSVTSSLLTPLRRNSQLLRATRNSDAQAILSGTKSLV